jgi:hypothetical protein
MRRWRSGCTAVGLIAPPWRLPVALATAEIRLLDRMLRLPEQDDDGDLPAGC